MKPEATIMKAFRNMKGKWTLALLAGAGLLLLLIGGLGTTGTKATTTAADSEAYRAALTEEVRLLCSEIRGVGEVTVLLTLESGESAVYAEDDGGYVSVGGEGLLLEHRPPRVAGVAVVCDGGSEPGVCETVREVLSAALGIGAHRVKVTAKK